MTVLPLEPDWSNPLRIDREYKTEITESRNMTEQRKALRQQPRRVFEFRAQLGRTGSVDLLSFVEARAQEPYVLPDPTRDTVTTALSPVAAGSLTFATPLPDWIQVGATLVLGKGRYAVKEAVTVASIAGGTVTLTDLLVNAWPAGSVVRDGAVGVLDQSFRFRLATDRSGTVEFRFFEDPGTHKEVYESPATLISGREVWLKKPNWRDNVDSQIEGQLSTLDFDIGVVSHDEYQDFNVRRFEAVYSFFERASAEEFIRFLHRKRGRQQEFWMPTWRPDFRISGVAASGTSAFSAQGTEQLGYFSSSVTMRRIAVFLRSGQTRFFTVTGMAQVGSDTQVSVTPALTEELSEATVSKISWMPLWRFAADKVTMEWPVASVCEAKVALTQLRADFSDDGYFSLFETNPDGNVASATRTYSLVGLPFISTVSEKGDAVFRWGTTAKRISTLLDATATLQVTTRFFLNSGGSPGAQIGASLVDSVTGTGSILLDVRRPIPASAGHVRFILSRVAAVPGDTQFESSTNTVSIRGRP